MMNLYKKLLSCIIILIVVWMQTSTFAKTINDIIRETSYWGISATKFSENASNEIEPCEIGKKKGLKAVGVNIDGYLMNAYYVFGEKMWDEKGWTYNGLSKIAYVLQKSDKQSDDNLTECVRVLTDSMRNCIGEPETIGKAVVTWNKRDYKVEIGKGSFSKYTGSDWKTVAIVVTCLEFNKPNTEPFQLFL